MIKRTKLLESRLFFFFGFFLLLTSVTTTQAQEFGGNPPGMKWRQIDTDTLRVIFPVEVEEQAQRVANTIHYLSKNGRRSVGDKQKKINFVLQNQTVVSNGYVGLAPFISELYLSQPQNSRDVGSNWLDMLTIHEYRHVLQRVNARRGITNLAYILSGELGWSYFSSLSIPNWFLEGDAVVIETANTAQGRGRIPAFYNGYKSMYIDGIRYNYAKARNGSIKDFVPNHYELGYLMSNYGREAYGNDIWKDVVTDAGSYKGIIYPFSKNLQKKTGNSTRNLFDLSLDHYESNWEGMKPKKMVSTKPLHVKDKKGTFTNYAFPHFDGHGNTIVYKSSFKEIGGFYRIAPDGTEKLIKKTGRILESYYSYKNEQLVWAEIGQDERWSWQVNSNIVVYDIHHKKRRRLTTSAKYFSPDLSYDGKKIVAFHASEDHNYRLHVLSLASGSLIKELPNPENFYFSYPKWGAGDAYIIAIARDQKGKNTLVKIDAESGQLEQLTPFTHHQLGVPWVQGSTIYFSASYTGVDNIHYLNLNDKKLFTITDVATGAYSPAVWEKKLYYSEFTSLGRAIKILDLEAAEPGETTYREPKNMDQFASVAATEEGGDISDSIPDKRYPSTKYSRASKLINLHSWSLYFADPNFEWALYSNDILNTLAMKLGVTYNRNDNNLRYFFNLSYAQLYPVFSLGANYTRRSRVIPVNDQNGNFVGNENVSWSETELKPGVSIPFDISSGLYTRKLSIGGKYAFSSVIFDKNEGLELHNYNLQSSQVDMSFANIRKKAKQNIYPSYTQNVYASLNNSLTDVKASQIFIESQLTFPGMFKNHNLVFQLAYQHEPAGNEYFFGDNFRYARGYNIPLYDYIYKVGSNYHMPLIYPDWGFAGLLYFYRLRSNAFFDYSRMHLVNPETKYEIIQMYNSLGAEMIVDARVLNTFDFSLGFRYSYLLNDDPLESSKKHSYEFFIPVIRF